MTEKKRIVVVGIGYVGLPAALLLARAGHTVVGVDINEAAVKAVNDRVLHLDEDSLKALCDDPEVIAHLSASTTPVEADVFIIAVPTPIDTRRKVADLTCLRNAVRSIVSFLRPGNLVIIESTVPPLTCRDVVTPMLEASGLQVGQEILLAHCPERILPGNIRHEIINNARIIGGFNELSTRTAKAIYASFVEGELLETDDLTAEFCKLIENAYRDVNIAFANEVAAVAEYLSIDGRQAIALANHHPRVKILQPGIGVGGHCIPIDPWFIKEVAPDDTRLITAARQVNDGMPARVAGRIRRRLHDIPQPRIIALGAAYKPDTRDLRESPALEVVRLLRLDGYQVELYDPLTEEYACEGTLAKLAEGADCIVVLVPHQSMLRQLETQHEAIVTGMRHPIIMNF